VQTVDRPPTTSGYGDDETAVEFNGKYAHIVRKATGRESTVVIHTMCGLARNNSEGRSVDLATTRLPLCVNCDKVAKRGR
jgi:hypothetical protein